MIAIFYLIFMNSINCTFFILLLYLMEPLIKKYLSAACIYRLWLVLLIGLLIPMRLDNSKALFHVPSPQLSMEEDEADGFGREANSEFYHSTISTTQSPEQLRLGTANTNNKSEEIVTYIIQNRYLFLSQLWILGTCLLLVVKLIQYHNYLKLLKRFIVPINQEDLKESLNICIQELHSSQGGRRSQNHNITIYQCPMITSPMTIGIFKPRIILPEGSYSDKDFYFILKHELIHIQRRDSLVKLVRLIVLALNWFNPFCYILSKHLDHWCETSCDELVIDNFTRSECLDYSKLLLKYTAVSNITTNTINMMGGNDNMKFRLLSIMEHRKKHSGKILVVLSLCLVFTTVIVSTITHTDVSASVDNAKMEEALKLAEEIGDNVTDYAETSSTNDRDPVYNGVTDEDMAENNSAPEETSTTDSLRQTVVKYAIQAEGARYEWGGNDLYTGVDTSGFTQAIYKKVGYDLPRTSKEQADICEKVSMDCLQEGDLIFYGDSDDNQVNHVGIYVGEDKIIHAKNAQDGVVIQDINYRTPFSAGRIIK